MIVYNITMKVDLRIEEDWIRWQKEEHIPDVMSTGCFTDHKFFRLLEQDESEGATYVIQYFAPSLHDYQQYIEEFSSHLREKTFQKWGDRFIAFRTLMQIVQ